MTYICQHFVLFTACCRVANCWYLMVIRLLRFLVCINVTFLRHSSSFQGNRSAAHFLSTMKHSGRPSTSWARCWALRFARDWTGSFFASAKDRQSEAATAGGNHATLEQAFSSSWCKLAEHTCTGKVPQRIAMLCKYCNEAVQRVFAAVCTGLRRWDAWMWIPGGIFWSIWIRSHRLWLGRLLQNSSDINSWSINRKRQKCRCSPKRFT